MDGETTAGSRASSEGDRPAKVIVETAETLEIGRPEEPTEAPEENKFQKAISAWRNIDLTGLIPTLDKVASDLVAHQRDSLVERKDLAQKTKDFRKLDDGVKLNEVKGLLKGRFCGSRGVGNGIQDANRTTAYQAYIDLVTNQNKTASSSFLQIYSPLSEAPDPYPLLEASVESLVVADEIVPKLESENRSLQRSNAKLTAQLEEAEGRLDEERKARMETEAHSDNRIKDIQNSWSAVLAEKQDNWDARERSLEERAENQERLMKELKASYEVNQRLEQGEDGGDRMSAGGATTAELDMVSADLERVSVRLAEVEARNEQLRLELAQSATQHGVNKSSMTFEDDPAFLRLRSENSSLLRKIDASRLERETQMREMEGATRSLKKETAALKEDGVALRAKLNQWGDYPNLKRELEILKSIEFSAGDDDFAGDEELTRPGIAVSDLSSGRESVQNLEQLLLARNKKLNNELTILRVSHQDLATKLEAMQDELSSTNMELEKSRSLTATLENDLTKVQDDTMSHHPAMSVAGTYKSRYPSMSYAAGRRGRLSPTSSIISGIEPTMPASPMSTLEGLRAGEPVGGGSGILPMITAQRDRFKKRITELDAELSKAYQTISSLRSEVAALQKDNLQLYEKSRFVSTYSKAPPQAGSNAYTANSNPSTVNIGGAPASPLDRYKSAYDAKISPFAAFRGKESARALKRMSLPERAMLQVIKVILANRTSRNIFALYFFGLHIAFILISFSSTASGADPTSYGKVVEGSVGALAAAGVGVPQGDPNG